MKNNPAEVLVYQGIEVLQDYLDDMLSLFGGEWVVIKPNLVKQYRENDPDEWKSVITSPSLIRQVARHCAEKVGEGGRVTICDAPQTDSSFAAISALIDPDGYFERLSKETGALCELVDLRDQEWVNDGGVIVERRQLRGDPNGKIRFDLGPKSLFYRHPGEGRYYGADYEWKEVNYHHQDDRQEYLIAGTPIKCDVFINMPKLKTHKKTGVTLNLKNLVGINADKNWLPHHVEGPPSLGGDQFPDERTKQKLERILVRAARRIMLRFPGIGPRLMKVLRPGAESVFGSTSDVVRSGNWFGNNTTWRMALDLNRCLLFGNPDGTLRDQSQPKRYYSIVDGIIGMEGSGPMQGDPVDSGVILVGTDPVAVDMVAATIMGFDWRKIPIIREAFALKSFPITAVAPDDVTVYGNFGQFQGRLLSLIERNVPTLCFEPHFGWKGHIESNSCA